MAKSLQAFTSWAVSKGRVANPNGSYPGQCVSLIQQYLNQVFGIPYAARGNAKDFVPPTFKRLSASTKRKPGDIIRYGRNYGGGYGHIGYIGHDGRYVDQNGYAVLWTTIRNAPFSGIESVWRPTRAFKLKNAIIPVPKPKPKYPRTVTVLRTANVRTKPSTKAPLGGSKRLNKGDKFTSVGLVSGDKVAGNNQWHKSSRGNYVWSGNIKV